MANIRLTNQWGGSFVYCALHIDAHRQHLLGRTTETVSDDPCPDCVAEEQRRQLPGRVREALLAKDFSHSRFKYSQIHLYRLDPTSPSGVMLAVSCDELMFNEIYYELRSKGLIRSSASPLSPTETR